MFKKYNITTHILFWVLLVFLVSTAVLIILMQTGRLKPFFTSQEKEIVVKKEPVYVTEVKEIEKETDWYYFVATAYSADDPAQGTNSTTATGKELTEGIIAVDPEIIPLGTIVEIKDMGFFIAEDTGGKIKGNRIDIYFETRQEAKEFGRRGIWINLPENDLELAELLR